MSRQLSNANIESMRQSTLVSAKFVQKPIFSSFLQSSQQKPAGYKFGSVSASKKTSSLDNEGKNDCYKKIHERQTKKPSQEAGRIVFDGEDNEVAHHLETSEYLNISGGFVNGFNKPKSQVSKSSDDLKSMSIDEQVCRKQLMQRHLPVIAAMELLDLNEDPEVAKQAMNQMFEQNIIWTPNEIEVWAAQEAVQEAAQKEVHLKLTDGSSVTAHPLLNEASGTIKDFLKTSAPEKTAEDLPINQEGITAADLEFMNKIVEVLGAADVKEHADDRAFWVENISKKKDVLTPLAEGVDSDSLIRRSNLADFLIFHAGVHFCTYILAERAQNMNLQEVRAMLHEEDDFDEEQRALINEFVDIQNA